MPRVATRDAWRNPDGIRIPSRCQAKTVRKWALLIDDPTLHRPIGGRSSVSQPDTVQFRNLVPDG